MSDNDDTVKLGYAASSNISFRGVIDTGMSRDYWDEMTQEEQDAYFAEELFALVDIWVEED